MTNSGGPPIRVATTERPHAIASRIDCPNGSISAGPHTTSAGGEPRRHVRVRDAADDANARAAFETRAQRAVADERERAATELRERVREAHDVLALGQRSDMHERRRVERRRRLDIGREALEVDARVDDLDLAARGGQLVLELAAQVVGDRDHRRCARDDAGGRAADAGDRADVAHVAAVRSDDERAAGRQRERARTGRGSAPT